MRIQPALLSSFDKAIIGLGQQYFKTYTFKTGSFWKASHSFGKVCIHFTSNLLFWCTHLSTSRGHDFKPQEYIGKSSLNYMKPNSWELKPICTYNHVQSNLIFFHWQVIFKGANLTNRMHMKAITITTRPIILQHIFTTFFYTIKNSSIWVSIFAIKSKNVNSHNTEIYRSTWISKPLHWGHWNVCNKDDLGMRVWSVSKTMGNFNCDPTRHHPASAYSFIAQHGTKKTNRTRELAKHFAEQWAKTRSHQRLFPLAFINIHSPMTARLLLLARWILGDGWVALGS